MFLHARVPLSRVTPRFFSGGMITIRQCLQKHYDRLFLVFCQMKVSHLFFVHIYGDLRFRPTVLSQRLRLSCKPISTSRLGISGVVEMYDGFQTLEITIMCIGFYKTGLRTLIDVP